MLTLSLVSIRSFKQVMITSPTVHYDHCLQQLFIIKFDTARWKASAIGNAPLRNQPTNQRDLNVYVIKHPNTDLRDTQTPQRVVQ
jgi:hypothetical protein